MSLVCNYIPIMDCDACYKTSINSPCISPLQFASGFAQGTQYYVWIIDKFGNVYRELTTVLTYGIIELNLNEYPVGFFNEFAGIFKGYLTTDLAGLNRVNLTFQNISYSCVIF